MHDKYYIHKRLLVPCCPGFMQTFDHTRTFGTQTKADSYQGITSNMLIIVKLNST